MTLSVLMSVYRSDDPIYLDCSLRSVWSDQTRKPDEIVLVEDGPLTDDLYEVIRRWEQLLEDKLVVLVNDINLGLTKSLNKGLAVVKGKYIARMDADDIAMPQRFEMQLDYMEHHSDVAVLGGALQEFDASDVCLNIRRYPADTPHILKYIYKASPCAHPAVMMRREIFDDGLKYDERYRTSQDIALWFDVLNANYRIGNLDEVVVKFRLDGDIFRRRSKSYAINELKIYCRGIRRLYGLFTWKYIYPLTRFVFRLMPVWMIKALYNSNIRKKILAK